ncbi:hypothetical protein COOONC_03929 [Cooperia oncophora]
MGTIQQASNGQPGNPFEGQFDSFNMTTPFGALADSFQGNVQGNGSFGQLKVTCEIHAATLTQCLQSPYQHAREIGAVDQTAQSDNTGMQ